MREHVTMWADGDVWIDGSPIKNCPQEMRDKAKLIIEKCSRFGLNSPAVPEVTVLWRRNEQVIVVYLDGKKIADQKINLLGWVERLVLMMGGKFTLDVLDDDLPGGDLPDSLAGYAEMVSRREIEALEAKRGDLARRLREINDAISAKRQNLPPHTPPS